MLARLITGHICLHAAMAGMRMAAPLLALKQGYSALAVGVLVALFSLTQVFLALPSGRFADRNVLSRPISLAVTTSIAATLIAVFFPVFPVLCFSALVTGGATGAASIALQRQVGRSAEGSTELKRMFSWLAIGPAISNFLGPFSAGLLIDHAGVEAGDTQGFQAAFLLMTLLPLGTWLAVRGVRDVKVLMTTSQAAQGNAVELLRQPMMRRLILVNWCLSSCWDVHTFVVPILGHEHQMGASVIGSILGAFAVAAAGIRVLMPLFAARLKEHVVVTGAMIVTCLLFAIYPFMQTPLSMGACSVGLGMALGSVQPMIMSTLHQITPDDRQGEALGLRLMAMNASSVVMPMLFGTVGAAVGLSLVFWAVAFTVGSGARSAWHLRAEHARHPVKDRRTFE